MSNEKILSTDTVASGLICGARPSENALALGYFTMTSTTQITTWYIGLYGAGASNTPAAGDTLALHAGWTEINPYTGNRPACTFAAATNANPSVATNSASPASYAITSTATVGGAFLCNAASGTSGTLFSAADFQSPGDRAVVNGDTLNVTYTLSLAG